MNRQVKIPILMSLLVVNAPLHGVEQYLVEGTVRFEGEESFHHPSEPLPFRIQVDGCRWLLHFPKRGRDQAGDYVEVGSDGSRCYYMNLIEGSVDARRRAGEEVGENVATAIIRDVPVPQFPFAHESGPIWLTFASRCYLSKLDGDQGFMHPPLSRNIGKKLNPNHYVEQRYLSTRSSGRFSPPDRIDLFADFREVSSGRTWESWPRSDVTNIVFRVVERGSGEFRDVPSQAELAVFDVNEGKTQASQKRMVRRWILTATNIVSDPGRISGMPRIRGLTVFSDHRFGEGFAMSYQSTNWLSDEEVRGLPAFPAAMEVARRGSWPSIWRILLLCVIVISFPIWLMLRREERIGEGKE